MRKLIVFVATAICITNLLAFSGGPLKSREKAIELPSGSKKVKIVDLNSNNTIVFRGVVTGESVTSVQRKAFELSNSAKSNDSLYLILDTPGGDVVAGEELIGSLKSLPQEIKTVTNFAASMGFIMVQSLGERLILPNGTLMSHRAFGGAKGQIPGELNSRVEYWTKRVENIEKVCARRMKMTTEAYKNLIVNEFWIDGEDAVAKNAADEVVLARCAKDLLESKVVETVRTFFGPVEVIWSGCPLITYPLDINFSKIETDSETDLRTIKDIFYSLHGDKAEFINKYLKTGMYQRYVK